MPGKDADTVAKPEPLGHVGFVGVGEGLENGGGLPWLSRAAVRKGVVTRGAV
jgi:hypothetical protein